MKHTVPLTFPFAYLVVSIDPEAAIHEFGGGTPTVTTEGWSFPNFSPSVAGGFWASIVVTTTNIANKPNPTVRPFWLTAVPLEVRVRKTGESKRG
jgi:hypothetical protein